MWMGDDKHFLLSLHITLSSNQVWQVCTPQNSGAFLKKTPPPTGATKNIMNWPPDLLNCYLEVPFIIFSGKFLEYFLTPSPVYSVPKSTTSTWLFFTKLKLSFIKYLKLHWFYLYRNFRLYRKSHGLKNAVCGQPIRICKNMNKEVIRKNG